MMGKNDSSRSRAAFTLIELLVCVSIIALLAGLLLPGLTSGKSVAQSVVCRGNLHQHGLGIQMYLADHAVFPPGIQLYNSNSASPNRWIPDLLRYVPSGSNAAKVTLALGGKLNNPEISLDWFRYGGVFQCPGEKLVAKRFVQSSYGYNYRGAGGDFNGVYFGLGVYPLGAGIGSTLTPARREAEVKAPSDTLAVGDGFQARPERVTIEADYLDRAFGMGVLLPLYPPLIDAAARRHRGKLNLLYCDGHVDREKYREVLYSWSDQWLRRFNFDHEPHRDSMFSNYKY